jgi:hypothetical protein
MDWKLDREGNKKVGFRHGFGLERPRRDGKSLPASWDGSPPGTVAGGWTDEPRRAATGGERRGRSGARFGGACSAAVQVRGKREEARVPLSGDGVHVHSVGLIMLRGPWP